MDKINKLSAVTVALHWMVAIAMIGMLGVGLYMVNAEAWFLYPWHKSIGVLIFVIVLARVAWRVRQGWPPALGRSSRFEQLAAKAVHWTLIVCTVAMPVTGMIYSGASGHGFGTLGVTVVPAQHNPLQSADVIPYSAAWSDLGQGFHNALGYLLLAAIVLHVAGALKHHVVAKDGTLRRMLGRTT
jgi:cytochrome b561